VEADRLDTDDFKVTEQMGTFLDGGRINQSQPDLLEVPAVRRIGALPDLDDE
jgi:hypothetical protein